MASPLEWTDRIAKLKENNELKSRTCKVFVKHPQHEICQCGRLRSRHSYATLHDVPLAEKTETGNDWNEGPDTSSVLVDVFGVLSAGGLKFVRCDNRTKTPVLYNLILDDCNGEKPNLIISAYGGAKYFTLSDKIEKDFVTGIIDLATRAGMCNRRLHCRDQLTNRQLPTGTSTEENKRKLFTHRCQYSIRTS